VKEGNTRKRKVSFPSKTTKNREKVTTNIEQSELSEVHRNLERHLPVTRDLGERTRACDALRDGLKLAGLLVEVTDALVADGVLRSGRGSVRVLGKGRRRSKEGRGETRGKEEKAHLKQLQNLSIVRCRVRVSSSARSGSVGRRRRTGRGVVACISRARPRESVSRGFPVFEVLKGAGREGLSFSPLPLSEGAITYLRERKEGNNERKERKGRKREGK
jgi:hypothetical protein